MNRRRGNLRGAATIVAAWPAGGLLVAGVLLVTRALDGGSDRTATTIRNAAATTRTVADTTAGGGTGDEALYEATAPGVVEIEATIKGGSGSAGAEAGQSPFGGSGAPLRRRRHLSRRIGRRRPGRRSRPGVPGGGGGPRTGGQGDAQD